MLISIITVVYNDRVGLEDTVKSVYKFAGNVSADVEFIIIDGNSSDGTKEYLKEIPNEGFYKCKFVSEKDSGIYDAMNKGLSLTDENSGYCLFLNAGDFFVSEASDIINESCWVSDIIVMGVESVDEAANLVKVRRLSSLDEIKMWPAYPHQGTFIKTALHLRFPYDKENFKILADYDFFSKMYSLNFSISLSQNVIAVFRQGGVSNTPSGTQSLVSEFVKIQRGYFRKVNYKLIFVFYFKYILRVSPFSSGLEEKIRNIFFK
jgi:putative colanic acid biosynthesis glycosyltransferase